MNPRAGSTAYLYRAGVAPKLWAVPDHLLKKAREAEKPEEVHPDPPKDDEDRS